MADSWQQNQAGAVSAKQGTRSARRRRFLVRLLFLCCLALLCLGALFVLASSMQLNLTSFLSHLVTPSRSPVVENPKLDRMVNHQVTWVANLADLSLDESSGLTSSKIHANTLWSINDSGGGPKLFAVGLDGATKATFSVDSDASFPSDWESLDSVELDGISYLVIGDVGDNFRWRSNVSILFVKEPSELEETETSLQVARTIEILLPQPFDFEAIAVDLMRERILLLTKRIYPQKLFSLPLRGSGPTEASEIGEIQGLPQPTITDFDLAPKTAKYRYMPSGMDIFASKLLVTTLSHVFLFDLENVQVPPIMIEMPIIGQREAITFAAGSDEMAYLSRERSGFDGTAELFSLTLSDLIVRLDGARSAPVASD